MRRVRKLSLFMEQEVVDADNAIFGCRLDDGTSLGVFTIPRSTWDDFDSPVGLVVTVEPGE